MTLVDVWLFVCMIVLGLQQFFTIVNFDTVSLVYLLLLHDVMTSPCQTLEHDRFKEALNKQRDDDAGLLEAKVNASLEKQKQQLEVEYK